MTDHFPISEFACPCCGLAAPHPTLRAALEQMRAHLGVILGRPGGVPLIVSSGTRCQARNAAVGGASKSQHVPQPEHGGYSIAADIQCRHATLEQLLDAAIDVPEFHGGGIGLYVKGAVRWIHVDIRPGRARWGEVDGKKADQLAVLAEDDSRRSTGDEEVTA